MPVDTTMARKSRSAGGGPDPTFAQRQCFGVVVHEGGHTGQVTEPGAQGKRPPRTDVERGHRFASRAHRPPAAGPTDDDRVAPTGPVAHVLHQIGQPVPEGFTVSRLLALSPLRSAPAPVRTRRPEAIDQSRRHLGTADIDGQRQLAHRKGASASGKTPAGLRVRAGGIECGTNRGLRSWRPRTHSMRRPPSTAHRLSPWSSRATRPGPCGAGCARTPRRTRT